MVDEASYLRLVARLALEDGGSKARQRGVGLQTHRNKLECQSSHHISGDWAEHHLFQGEKSGESWSLLLIPQLWLPRQWL